MSLFPAPTPNPSATATVTPVPDATPGDVGSAAPETSPAAADVGSTAPLAYRVPEGLESLAPDGDASPLGDPGTTAPDGSASPGAVTPVGGAGGEASPGMVAPIAPAAPPPPTPSDAVRYSAQTLTPTQKVQARTNIDAAPAYPRAIAVTGILTSDGATPEVFPVLRFNSISQGKPSYATSTYGVDWDEGSLGWILSNSGGGQWTSTADVASPDLVPSSGPTGWAPVAPATGTPVVTSADITTLDSVTAAIGGTPAKTSDIPDAETAATIGQKVYAAGDIGTVDVATGKDAFAVLDQSATPEGSGKRWTLFNFLAWIRGLAHTWTGQHELTNQAATTANSAMTRGLVDARSGFYVSSATARTRSTQNAWSNDEDLTRELESNSAYYFKIRINQTLATSANMGVRLYYGGTINGTGYAIGATTASQTGSAAQIRWMTVTAGSVTESGGSTSNSQTVEGIILTVTAGTFALQLANTAATGVATRTAGIMEIKKL